MSGGDAYEVKNHDAAWVLRNAIQVGLDSDAGGFVAHTRRCAILPVSSIEEIAIPKAA